MSLQLYYYFRSGTGLWSTSSLLTFDEKNTLINVACTASAIRTIVSERYRLINNSWSRNKNAKSTIRYLDLYGVFWHIFVVKLSSVLCNLNEMAASVIWRKICVFLLCNVYTCRICINYSERSLGGSTGRKKKNCLYSKGLFICSPTLYKAVVLLTRLPRVVVWHFRTIRCTKMSVSVALTLFIPSVIIDLWVLEMRASLSLNQGWKKTRFWEKSFIGFIF